LNYSNYNRLVILIARQIRIRIRRSLHMKSRRMRILAGSVASLFHSPKTCFSFCHYSVKSSSFGVGFSNYAQKRVFY